MKNIAHYTPELIAQNKAVLQQQLLDQSKAQSEQHRLKVLSDYYLYKEDGLDYVLCPYCQRPSKVTHEFFPDRIELHRPLGESQPDLVVPACAECLEGRPLRDDTERGERRTRRLYLKHPLVYDSSTNRNHRWAIPFILWRSQQAKKLAQSQRNSKN